MYYKICNYYKSNTKNVTTKKPCPYNDCTDKVKIKLWMIVENTRFELVTSCMPCKRSNQLS